MSKKFRGKTCVYCSSNTSTGDHIFPRTFFPISERANLPTVPSCEKCNRNKSTLEHYLATALLFGGRYRDALENLSSMGPGRLAKNVSLHKMLARAKFLSMNQKDLDGIASSMALPFDGEKFLEFFRYVAKGLMYYEFNQLFDHNNDVSVWAIPSVGDHPIRDLLTKNAVKRVHRNLGHGAFVYSGAQGVDNPNISVWEISVFGGLLLGDDNGRVHETSVGILTGPKAAG